MSAPPLCKNCGGGLPQHQEGPCWCKTCMSMPAAERCREYEPRPPKSAEKSAEGFGKKPPKPPKKAPKSMSAAEDSGEAEDSGPPLPPPGTTQRDVLDAIRGFEKGATDFEVALKTGRELHDVIAARSELVAISLLWDSGIRRRDIKGHENVVWALTPSENLGQPEATPLLVRDDVYVEQGGRSATLHAGQTAIRLTGVPGDLVEVQTLPPGADPDQEGGGEVTLLLVVEGSEEVYEAMRNPFTTPEDVLEAMNDLISPALNTLTGIRKDI